MSSRRQSNEKKDKHEKLLNAFRRTYEAQYNKPKGGPLFFIGKTKNSKVAGAFVSLKVANGTYDRHARKYVISLNPMEIDEDHKVYIFGIPKNIKQFFKGIGSTVKLDDKFIEYGEESDVPDDDSFSVKSYREKDVEAVIETIKDTIRISKLPTIDLTDLFVINERISASGKKAYTKIIEIESDKDKDNKILKRPLVPTVKRTKIKVKGVSSKLQSKFQYLQSMSKSITTDTLKFMNLTNYASNSTNTIPVATRNVKVNKETKKKTTIATVSDDGIVTFKSEYFSILNGMDVSKISPKSEGYLFTYVRLTNKDNALFNYYHFLHEVYDMKEDEIFDLFESTSVSYPDEASLVRSKYEEFSEAMQEEEEEEREEEENREEGEEGSRSQSASGEEEEEEEGSRSSSRERAKPKSGGSRSQSASEEEPKVKKGKSGERNRA